MKPSGLSDEIKSKLKNGSKVEFKWYGNADLLYVGRVIKHNNRLYFVAEHNYKDDVLINESMKLYNPLEMFFNFTYFKILDKDGTEDIIIVLKTSGKNDSVKNVEVKIFLKKDEAEEYCIKNTDKSKDEKHWQYAEIIENGKSYEPARYANY